MRLRLGLLALGLTSTFALLFGAVLVRPEYVRDLAYLVVILVLAFGRDR